MIAYPRTAAPAASTRTDLTLFLLVDAMRPDYLAHAPYLRELAAAGSTGALREGFGFVPRQAYFGGLSTEEYGFTNMYCFDPARSPFTAARYLGGREAAPGAREFVEACARDKMTAFERSYAGSAQIPLGWLPSFDLVEKRAPWDRAAGYRSCFEILEGLGWGWHQCIWPETNRLEKREDESIVEQVLGRLEVRHRLACVHLQELDSLGHAFGPGSRQLQAGVAATDRLCRRLIEDLKARYDRLSVVLFGDHGMVNVTRTLDLFPILEGTGLVFGADYAFFLDSTMARFWFFHRQARRKVEEALGRVAGGRVLGPADLERFGLARCDSRNGELYFLADPGVLILPNFFQPGGDPIPGMHGYDPDCMDNLGLFLLYDTDRPELAGTRLGKVDPHQIFPALLRSVGLEPAAYTAVPPPAPQSAAGAAVGYTAAGDAAAESLVQSHLDRIVSEIQRRFGEVEAVVLTGSFGRGEGGVCRDDSGRWRPINDYDLMVVDGRDLAPELRDLGTALASEFGIDFVDLSHSRGGWEGFPLTLFTYDLRYGSRVLAGDPGVLERLPPFAPADIPSHEFLRLLFNRTAGLLSGLDPAAGGGLEGRGRYLGNQIVKALMAMGDWHLHCWRGYDSSYRRRRDRFASLAPGAGVDPAVAAAILRAYEAKLRPSWAGFGGPDEIRAFFPALASVFRGAIGRETGRSAPDLAAAMEAFAARPGAVRTDRLYAGLPLLLAAAFGDQPDRALAEARRHFGTVLPAIPTEPEGWEALRAQAVAAWFEACH